MANRLNINRSAISKHLKRMQDDNMIRREGSQKSGRWIIINKKRCIHPIRFHCYIVTLLHCYIVTFWMSWACSTSKTIIPRTATIGSI